MAEELDTSTNLKNLFAKLGGRKLVAWAIVMCLAFIALGLSWIDAVVWKDCVIWVSGAYLASNAASKFPKRPGK